MDEFFGIDIGGTSVKWAVLGEDFSIRERGSIPTDFSTAEEAVSTLMEIVEPYVDRVRAIGVSAPGGIYEGDPDGVIHRGGALTYMDGCPVGRLLRERFDMPVAVDNDGKCCALGEYAAGALRGANGFAGEFSFIRNDAQAPVSMGNIFGGTGSWRTLVALMLSEKGMEDDGTVDGRRAFEWVAAGDEAARRGLDRYALMFDNMLLNLQAVLDPDVFAIAGGISCHPELMEALERQMEVALSGFAGPLAGFPRPNVVAAQLGNDANLYGAVQGAMRLTQS